MMRVCRGSLSVKRDGRGGTGLSVKTTFDEEGQSCGLQEALTMYVTNRRTYKRVNRE